MASTGDSGRRIDFSLINTYDEEIRRARANIKWSQDMRERARERLAKSEPLEVVARKRGEDPEQFAQRVAEQYQRAVRQTRYPATEMAKVSGVPARTVHSWIRQARKLGALPPGTQGRAG